MAYAGYDAIGRLVGYAIVAAAPGFADVITLIYGYDAQKKSVIGMKVLDNKETPGLGDRIVKDSAFAREFSGVTTPLRGLKRGAGSGAPNEVDLITGATISSRTVVAIINRSLEKWAPLLAALPAGGAP
jgi:electron transport complex protein RnfG